LCSGTVNKREIIIEVIIKKDEALLHLFFYFFQHSASPTSKESKAIKTGKLISGVVPNENEWRKNTI